MQYLYEIFQKEPSDFEITVHRIKYFQKKELVDCWQIAGRPISHSCIIFSQDSDVVTKPFCVSNFEMCLNVTRGQCQFHRLYNVEPSIVQSIRLQQKQFKDSGYMCVGKTTGRYRSLMKRILESDTHLTKLVNSSNQSSRGL